MVDVHLTHRNKSTCNILFCICFLLCIFLLLSALVNHTKSLDPTRAVTFVTSQTADKDQAVSSQWSQKVKNIYAQTR
jgi:hypothetical protein